VANLDDLGYTSITEMTPAEGLELIRQVRLRRRTIIKTTKQQSSISQKSKSKAKKMDINKLTDEEVSDLLLILEGSK
jgi:hypothetical protein